MAGGPRHLALHPQRRDRFYLLTELSEDLVLFGWDGERADLLSRTSLRPPAWAGTGADIHVHASGAFLLVTLRCPEGEGLVVRVALDADGLPAELTPVGSGGRVPRNAVLHGDTLYVANRESDVVQVFDVRGPAPVPTRRIAVPTPFCVRLLPEV